MGTLPYLLMFFSGFAGLGYEMVWVRSLSAGLGHEIVSVLSVTSAFFVGTAVGAWLLDRPVRTSKRPTRWYATLEAGIGLWAVVLTQLMPAAVPAGARLMGIAPSAALQWSVSFFLPLLMLLPATLAMGATLPAMDCIAHRRRGEDRMVGGLYGANTFGAVMGTLVATFWIVPAVGFTRTQYLLAAVNLMCAVGVLCLGTGHRGTLPARVNTSKRPHSRRAGRLLATLFFTGVLGIGYEVLTVRILSQVLENTVFSYAILLSIYLLGTAGGAAVYQGHLAKRPFAPTLSTLLIFQVASCAIGMWLLHFSTEIYAVLGRWDMRTGEIGLATVVFFPPTLVMGALFSHLAQNVKLNTGALGIALTANTLGAALAPFLFGILLLPACGPAAALFAVVAGYALLLPDIHRNIPWPVIGCLAVAGLLLARADAFDFNRLAPGEQAVVHRHGIMADVTVVKDARNDFHLKVNNHYQMGGTASRYSDQRQAYIPLMLHPNPKSALFLGLGTGTTFSAACNYPGLRVDGVELIPELIPLFAYFIPSPGNAARENTSRVFTADARRFVLARRQPYDVIVADLFHPSRDGAGFLYTQEHFSAIRHCLSESGIFCQWLPLYQMNIDLLKLIVRTFLKVFPEGTAFIAHHSLTQPIIGLVGGRSPLRIDPGALARRLTHQDGLANSLRFVGLPSVYTLAGCYLADGNQLKEFSGTGPYNTDDHPVVLFKAPSYVYGEKSAESTAGKLLSVMGAFTPDAATILSPTSTDEEKRRLSAYFQARNAYLQTGARTPPSRDVQQILSQVAGPLLDVVRTSPDFEAAFRPLLAIADRLHRKHPHMAEKLLSDLEFATPHRSEPANLRRQWATDG